MTPIQAVLFDYGMVLSGPPVGAAWKQMETLLHADAESFHAAYWASRDAYDRGVLSGVAYWQRVAAALGEDLDDTTLAELIAADTAVWTEPNEPMIAWAARLQRAGFKTGVLSNLGDEMEAGILRRFAWLADFNHHTFSHRLGMAKPDAAIYRHAAVGLGLAPAEVLFIDDRAENIAAARAAGMAAIQYVDYPSFLAVMESAGYSDLLTL
ncbi:HAD family hydrolase [Granulicella paludicola]|uniref:HAD family hydrolase n=1 Tax=Granulicella paludicola TaxID=474951 RepID=UPI0021DF4A0A|nr:HAD family phosphatase [Granulicella paludicola]